MRQANVKMPATFSPQTVNCCLTPKLSSGYISLISKNIQANTFKSVSTSLGCAMLTRRSISLTPQCSVLTRRSISLTLECSLLTRQYFIASDLIPENTIVYSDTSDNQSKQLIQSDKYYSFT